MEPRNMHAHVPGATPVAQPSPPPPAQPPEPSPLPGPDMPMVEPAIAAPPVPDTPEAQEIKAELAHLDEIEATLPPHDDDGDGDGDDGGDAEHHAGAPHHKKRRHR
jgi:hypothetical protein